MGLQQSKEELLYQQFNYGNADGIQILRSIDKEGKTPLMAICMRPNQQQGRRRCTVPCRRGSGCWWMVDQAAGGAVAPRQSTSPCRLR
uniref:Uncharacterized protein n=1 Tax=Setaria italica TaxID=4555 RepID=K3Y1R4_SETIT